MSTGLSKELRASQVQCLTVTQGVAYRKFRDFLVENRNRESGTVQLALTVEECALIDDALDELLTVDDDDMLDALY